jgi:hypothetical protein
MIFYGAIVGYIVLRTITGYQDEKTNTQAKYDSNKYKVTYVHEDYDFNDLPLVDVKNITYKSKNDENWNLMTSSRKGHIVRYAGGEFKYLKICSTELQKSKKIKIYADGKLITPDEDKTVKGEYYNIYTYDLNNCDFIEIKMKKDINMIYTFLYVKDSEFKHDYSAIHYNEIFYGE